MPAVLANSTAPSREVMVPAPMFIVPGRALARSISSLIDFGPAIRVTTIDMFLVSMLIGARSLSGSYGRFCIVSGLSTMVVSMGINSV